MSIAMIFWSIVFGVALIGFLGFIFIYLPNAIDFAKVPITTGMAKIIKREESKNCCLLVVSIGKAWAWTSVTKEVFAKTNLDGEIKIEYQKPRWGNQLRVKKVIGI